jgi:hypothetical protein
MDPGADMNEKTNEKSGDSRTAFPQSGHRTENNVYNHSEDLREEMEITDINILLENYHFE